MGNLETFESLVINKIINVYLYVRERRYKESKKVRSLLTLNIALVDLDYDLEQFPKSNYYFDLMSLLLSGHIRYDDEDFDFTTYLSKEERSSKLERIYLITISVLIALELKENNNFYKCIKNAESNAKFLLDNIKDILQNYYDEDFDIPNDLLSLLAKESKEFYKIIVNSGSLVK
ncbi:MAG: hypothetical protein MJ248_04615 [Bacilli bacterium]|nr:hypothetical protein [Bacilli bacterium]